MNINNTINRFFDDNYIIQHWDSIVILDNYVATNDVQLAMDLECWLEDNDIPFRRTIGKSTQIWMFQIIDRTL